MKKISPKVIEYVDRKLSEDVFYFGSAGASLTKQTLDNTASNIGLVGERQVSKILQTFVRTHPYCVLVDSIHINNNTNNDKDSDHVLIIGDKLIVVDTKNWKNSSLYTIEDNWIIKRNNRNFQGGRNLHTLKAKYLFAKTFETNPIMIVCISGTDIRICKNKNYYRSPFRLCDSSELQNLLEQLYTKINPMGYNKELIANIVLCAVKPVDKYQQMLEEIGVEKI